MTFFSYWVSLQFHATIDAVLANPSAFHSGLLPPPPSIEPCCLLVGSRSLNAAPLLSLLQFLLIIAVLLLRPPLSMFTNFDCPILAKNNGTACYIYLKIFLVKTTTGLFRCSTKSRTENCPRSIHSQQRNKSLNLRAGKTRIALLEEAQVGECASGCHGKWPTRSAVIRQAGNNERGNL